MSREVELARELLQLNMREAELKRQLKEVDERYAQTESALQQELVDQGKTSTGHIEGVGVFTLRRELFPSVVKANMGRLMAYLRECGDGALIEETVHPMTLKSYCKKSIEALAERFAEDPELADSTQATLGITDEVVAPQELAKRFLEAHGVSTFQKMTLAHTRKGV
jgi:hypothetical protein